ncbi:hypothetical protein ACQUZQ_21530, partial [Aeromonas veronii]|uniref:hypothetical protein n=1 Tax=Aeromonas veronii TaxID=654 RepID=UPI003D1ADB3B
PGRKAWFRIWVSDAEGNGCGLDPFFDTIMYLKETGQLAGNDRKRLTLKLHGMDPIQKPTWMELKTGVLGTKEQKIEVCKKFKIA